MNFSALFRKPNQAAQLAVTPPPDPSQPTVTHGCSTSQHPKTGLTGTNRNQPGVSGSKNFSPDRWCLTTQLAWIEDPWPLRIWEKSRQVGATKTDALDSVLKVSHAGARFDVWVSSRDELQAALYLEDCKEWARLLNLAATCLGRIILGDKASSSAFVLQFANGRRIHCLSSNPNAFAGKRGHVKLDEFALHPDQRALYKIAKPVTQWGGTFSILSTHRGPGTLFNQIIREIRQDPNSSPWHLFSYPIQQAVKEGIVARMNEKSGRNETDDEFLARTRQECRSEDDWNQEFCCIPADENSAFISHELITLAEDPSLRLMSLDQLIAYAKANPDCRLFAGMDVARKLHLCVIDVGEQIGDVMHDRLRIELKNQPFKEIRKNLYPILALPQLRRCCIDNTGNGIETAEEAQKRFGSKVEPITFSLPVKERLAFLLHRQFEDHALRIPIDDKLRADLHGIKKDTTANGRIRFIGDTDDSHCDRFWAKALRQESSRPQDAPWILVG
jgi:phage FluMu gp28-like protein